MFYFNDFKFNRSHHGDYLEFINDTTITTIDGSDSWSTCTFGELISKDLYRAFEISFKWRISQETSRSKIAVGFASNMNISDWNKRLGYYCFENNLDSVCIEIKTSPFGYHYLVYHSDQTTKRLDYNLGGCKKFDSKDVFMVKFDFATNRMIVYHNEKQVAVLKVDTYEYMQQIMPAISMYGEGNIVEVIDCVFHRR